MPKYVLSNFFTSAEVLLVAPLKKKHKPKGVLFLFVSPKSYHNLKWAHLFFPRTKDHRGRCKAYSDFVNDLDLHMTHSQGHCVFSEFF